MTNKEYIIACYDKPLGFTNRNVCSACKMAWLEEEADDE